MKISACVITKNEAGNIKRWLKDMRKISDEMIVVDTGSADDTVSLSEAAGAKVFHHIWREDFAAAKNFAISQATGDWILFPDADEYFSEGTLKILADYLNKFDKKDVDAFLCRIVNVDADQNNRILQISYACRVFRNVPYLRYEGSIHEVLVNAKRTMRAGILKELYHIGYSSSLTQYKAERNLSLLQKAVQQRGKRPMDDRYLCDCYKDLGDYEKAAYYAWKYISGDAWDIIDKRDIYKKYLDVLVVQKKMKPQEILQHMDQAMRRYPKDPVFAFTKGEYCFGNTDYDQAHKYLLLALHLDRALQPGDIENTTLFDYYRPEANYLLGKIFLTRGDFAAAQRYFVQALQHYLYEERYFLSAFALLKKQPFETALAVIKSLYDFDRVADQKFLWKMLKKTGDF